MEQMELMMTSKIEGSVTAVYKKTGVPSYENNPLIECLPKLGEIKEVIDKLSCYPSSVLHSSPSHTRASELIAAISNMFIALPQHYELAEFIDSKIKQGYISRNPCLKISAHMLQSNYENMLQGNVIQSNLVTFNYKAPVAAAIYGKPGTGKSISEQKILALYPQVIVHDSLGITQITYLYINFPHNSSLHVLCKNFFDALNIALNKPDTVWLERRESLDSMLAKIQAAVVRFNIGILIIDEFQSWRSKTKDSDLVIGFLVSLINTVKLPVVFSGTQAAKGRLESTLALARRVIGFDEWDPLKTQSDNDSESKNLWTYFSQKLWKYQYLSKPPVPLSPEISDVWFDYSQGILDIAIKLYIQVQLRAIKSKKEEISVELFRRVYQDDFKPIHSIMNALRSKNPELIAEYADLPPSRIAVKIASLHKSIVEANKTSAIETMEPTVQELLDCLIQIGYEKKVAQPAVETVFSEHPNSNKISLLPLVIKLLAAADTDNITTTKRVTKSKEKRIPPQFEESSQVNHFSKIVGENTE
ncbi:ATP-binding protein [uncultured Paraglaciecola sp.]|mgnify:FL=1|uniref:ATP-binding protein n=1 Tax=uncultured Paraglaciecola sp. TaxID=1765024 RepID=UPI0030DD39BB|tara:strand:- start:8067 stop:9659 length:1593 start_codon:yes stop_codon:yes gene_type:complete